MSSESDTQAAFKRTQDFGEKPTEVRQTNHYQDEYVHGFVERWDELIDWDGRAASEGRFFIDTLKRYGCKTVLDAAAGTGFHSVQLLKAGFDVTTVDGSPQMLIQAFNNAHERGLILSTVRSDWRWLSRDIAGRYDALICLGNSFTHIFDEHDRRRALAEFYSMLNHNGILILDQRNYDALLDGTSGPGHKYYYCGEHVSAEPDHVDNGLARFKYTFPGNDTFYLNMYPLRRDYVHKLMNDVGFQHVNTYGDFQSTYDNNSEPDFFIHVVEKAYRESDEDIISADWKAEPLPVEEYSDAVKTAQAYYNSDDAENFYSSLWGGEDIHIGLYQSNDEPVIDASHRTVEHMAEQIGPSLRGAEVLDIGGGYGGSARYIAREYQAKVVSLNLSEVQNRRGRRQNLEQGLADQVRIVDGDFENIPYRDNSFDVVWSQDAMLHSGNRVRVLEEARRVLKPGGTLIFTDPMADDECPKGVLAPILARIQLDTMGSPGFYRKELNRLGFTERDFDVHTEQVSMHYGRVREELNKRADELVSNGTISQTYVDNMREGLGHWVDGGKAGYLAWGIMIFDG
ncbi:glycine/sarcosine N-methyltransferase [Salinisphaera orenii]|uniref:glycine/sarcosine N-methyltransferase n=1 Tax=Salinisphaera orenii TaxID=856731 RepID=UPI000DBE0416